MPAVTVHLRWPDGQHSSAYSPSTAILDHLQAGHSYPLGDFMSRAERGLNAASERVKVVKGFYCSSAMDSLAGLRMQARSLPEDARVEVLELLIQGAGKVHASGYGDI
ncbi:MSMEG_0570 family nitrogen starvation response protein [Pseudomonas sp. HR96]|uniref:MSMEG_0570 family nitrogen starvation response protein n=1 Tax=Pseudomonas sp. HR96 TaxID=1027966 RepID=UPI002A7582C5|nr:MSMEG_0570 family nitrogen starvation response protein [Pseudomonas sp. HR96]WPO98350.1 MSMEG_0570 family nitrogen starvation response protein [Pseudomonas sp. HR96]